MAGGHPDPETGGERGPDPARSQLKRRVFADTAPPELEVWKGARVQPMIPVKMLRLPSTRWERFKAWLRGLFSGPAADRVEP